MMRSLVAQTQQGLVTVDTMIMTIVQDHGEPETMITIAATNLEATANATKRTTVHAVMIGVGPTMIMTKATNPAATDGTSAMTTDAIAQMIATAADMMRPPETSHVVEVIEIEIEIEIGTGTTATETGIGTIVMGTGVETRKEASI